MPRVRNPALPLLREAIHSGEAFPPYFSINDVAAWLETRRASPARSSLRAYLSRLLGEGNLHDAGRGWYCRQGERPVFETAGVRPLLQELAAAFPLLAVTPWSTRMLNPWLHHLVATGHMFLQVERDAIEPVADHLDTAGWKVFANPAKAASPRVHSGENTVILRPINVHAPLTVDGKDLLPERVLVDLRVEIDRLSIMDLSEYHSLAFRLATETRLIMGTLLRYASKRNYSAHDLFGNQLTAIFSENAVDRFMDPK